MAHKVTHNHRNSIPRHPIPSYGLLGYQVHLHIVHTDTCRKKKKTYTRKERREEGRGQERRGRKGRKRKGKRKERNRKGREGEGEGENTLITESEVKTTVSLQSSLLVPSDYIPLPAKHKISNLILERNVLSGFHRLNAQAT